MSIQDQFRNFTTHNDGYASIDPKSTLSGSADGKVVCVAGASLGIGQATAVAFAEAGAAAVYLTAQSKADFEETCRLIAKTNPDTQTAYSVCDVTQADQVAVSIADCVAKFGGVDVADCVGKLRRG